MLENAFNYIIAIHSREITLTRPGTVPTVATVKMSPSRYKRDESFDNAITSKGREFVVSTRNLGAFGIPKKGDILTDGSFYESVIYEVRELHNLGGQIMGYRIRCS